MTWRFLLVFCYTPEEFVATLYNIAEGKIRTESLITSKIGVDGVPGAFKELRSPETHAKIIVEHWH